MARLDWKTIGIIASCFFAIAGTIVIYESWQHHRYKKSQISKDYNDYNISSDYDSDYSFTTSELSVTEDPLDRILPSLFGRVIAECENNYPVQGLDFNISCLQCICGVLNNCEASMNSNGEQFGIFKISKPYWIDAGSPTVNGQELNSDAYSLCVNDQCCAAETVTKYMDRYKRDCDGNNIIDCLDYVAIHILGPSGCTKQMPSKFRLRVVQYLDFCSVEEDLA